LQGGSDYTGWHQDPDHRCRNQGCTAVWPGRGAHPERQRAGGDFIRSDLPPLWRQGSTAGGVLHLCGQAGGGNLWTFEIQPAAYAHWPYGCGKGAVGALFSVLDIPPGRNSFLSPLSGQYVFPPVWQEPGCDLFQDVYWNGWRFQKGISKPGQNQSGFIVAPRPHIHCYVRKVCGGRDASRQSGNRGHCVSVVNHWTERLFETGEA